MTVLFIHDLASRIWENTYGKILSKEQLDYMFDMMYAPDNILKQMEELHHQYFIILAGRYAGRLFIHREKQVKTRTIFKRSIPYRKCMARESGVLSSNKVLTI